jgi:hypothetical protein
VKHLTHDIITDGHYLPNNNARTAFLICGVEDLDKFIQEETSKTEERVIRTVADGWCPVCSKEYATWYVESLKKAAEAIKTRSGPPEKSYPHFVGTCKEIK